MRNKLLLVMAACALAFGTLELHAQAFNGAAAGVGGSSHRTDGSQNVDQRTISGSFTFVDDGSQAKTWTFENVAYDSYLGGPTHTYKYYIERWLSAEEASQLGMTAGLYKFTLYVDDEEWSCYMHGPTGSGGSGQGLSFGSSWS